ncbi:MAG: hypothetical protein C7B46_05385 [Sulfobacillus benefaciens]|uniref:Glycosyltransferase family 1 protein n=1 Tax=Sulfobacillus benefaciens TaxID=453960 RepID=A0A2T2XIN1_9FIRM|nr:MAG: hypothetical protein C7B46_05385 [Sulfobacillus benefaciens]
MASSFNITIIRPPGYVHSDAFREVAETVRFGLSNLGYAVELSENQITETPRTIVFGAHLLDRGVVGQLPPATILYNLEQIDPKSEWLQGSLLELIRRHITWDYSPQNIARLTSAGWGHRLIHVPIGYVPQMTRIVSTPVQDVDVLFYGSVNARRQAVLDALRASGLRVATAFGVYGRERDQLIARAKIVLNIHYYEAAVPETVRLSYLFANQKAVVSETGPMEDLGILAHAAVYVPYGQLTRTCIALVTQDALRKQLEQQAIKVMRQVKEEAILASALAQCRTLSHRSG